LSWDFEAFEVDSKQRASLEPAVDLSDASKTRIAE